MRRRMVKRLFFDTETTGLPHFPYPPSKNFKKYNRCRIVEMAWVITSDTENIIEKRFLIKPDNWVISDFISKIHGITQEMAIKDGVDINVAFAELLKDMEEEEVEWIIAHNTPFDVYVTKAEMWRNNNIDLINKFDKVKKYCTLVKSRKIWKGQKNNLSSVYERLFGENFEGAHTALEDTKACRDIYFEINKID